MTPRWRPTSAALGGLSVGAVLLGIAVVARRADLLILAAPLTISIVVGLLRRPAGGVDVEVSTSAESLLENQRTVVAVTVTARDYLDAVAIDLALPRYVVAMHGRSQRATSLVPGETHTVELEVRSIRWGRDIVGPAQAYLTGSHGLLECGPFTGAPQSITTLPLQDAFDAIDTVPRAEGIVGPHRSRRPGDGTDIAGVRGFVLGDRLRRINWPVSLRLGELHVTSTLSDRDASVILVLDSQFDLGYSAGVGGSASSLDLAVRAAAAIGEHYLRHGDRVGLVDMGQAQRRIRPGAGRTHLLRLLDVLLDVGPSRTGGITTTVALGELPPGALVIMLSPLVGEGAITRAATIARSGHSLLVIDTLPPDAAPPRRSEWTEVAWRLWLLERLTEIGRLAELGIPVVPWRGAGSLDEVLRDVSRAAATPKARL